MPKRNRDVSESREHEKPSKAVNVAYGEYNKRGDTIPCKPIPKPTMSVGLNRRLTVVAWNLNGIRSFVEKRGDLLKQLWERDHLDILGITEHKVTDKARADEIESSIRKLLSGHDIRFIWSMCSYKKGYAGSLAIVRGDLFERIEGTSFGYDTKPDPEGRIITLEFKNTAVVIAYVPNSGMKLDRLKYRVGTWDKEFSNYCTDLSRTKSVIIAGDLNVAHRDEDIWNVDAPHIPKLAGTTSEERKSFQNRFLDAGFVDSFACMHPEKTGWFSYWSVKAKNKPKNRGLRLDYVLVDKHVKLLDAFIRVGLCKDGDHCPVGIVAELDKANI